MFPEEGQYTCLVTRLVRLVLNALKMQAQCHIRQHRHLVDDFRIYIFLTNVFSLLEFIVHVCPNYCKKKVN